MRFLNTNPANIANNVVLCRLPCAFWVILVAYFALAGIYAVITPPFEKPDENWHVAMAAYIMENGRLPNNASPTSDHYARQEANQPPLYYLTLAPLWRVLGFNELTPGMLVLAKPVVRARAPRRKPRYISGGH